MRQPVLLFILKGEMDCTETADRRLGSSVQLAVAVGIPVAWYPPGRRRQSPTSGSHRTQHADFPHWARRTLIHSMAIACNFG
jgi:hypothetical protein